MGGGGGGGGRGGGRGVMNGRRNYTGVVNQRKSALQSDMPPTALCGQAALK